MQHGAISLQGTSRSRNEDRYDVAVSVQCCTLSYGDTCISNIASCTCWSVPCCLCMRTTSWSQTAAAHALRQAIRCEQPIVQGPAALRLMIKVLLRSQTALPHCWS